MVFLNISPRVFFYHFIDSISIIYRVQQALELNPFILMGHSMGGGISTLMAATFPEFILALILIEGMGPLSRKAEENTKISAQISFGNAGYRKKERHLFRKF